MAFWRGGDETQKYSFNFADSQSYDQDIDNEISYDRDKYTYWVLMCMYVYVSGRGCHGPP